MSAYLVAGYTVYWKFPTAAERSALSAAANEIGRIAWQEDDDTLWLLKDTTPTWISLGSGGGSSLSYIDGGNITDTYIGSPFAVDGGSLP